IPPSSEIAYSARASSPTRVATGSRAPRTRPPSPATKRAPGRLPASPSAAARETRSRARRTPARCSARSSARRSTPRGLTSPAPAPHAEAAHAEANETTPKTEGGPRDSPGREPPQRTAIGAPQARGEVKGTAGQRVGFDAANSRLDDPVVRNAVPRVELKLDAP